ncbi:MAG: PAS domain-containing protein [Pseudomonadota bacterium]
MARDLLISLQRPATAARPETDWKATKMDGDDFTRDGFLEFDSYRMERRQGMIHSELRALQSYWNEIRAGRTTPMRSDIDPRDMECDARNLFILENLGRGNIRFRLAGTAIVDAFGMELRGMNARAIMAAGSRESFTALISEVLEDPGTGYARLHNAVDERDIWEISLLPLRSDFGMIDRVIGCLHPLTGQRSRRRRGPLRFRIEQMKVDTIISTIPDPHAASAVSLHSFAEDRSTFVFNDGSRRADEAPRLRTIDGGLDASESSDRGGEKPGRGHLRLVKD